MGTLSFVSVKYQKLTPSILQKAKCKSSLETALRLVQQAVEEDRAHNYEEALSLYQHGLVYFLESLNCTYLCTLQKLCNFQLTYETK